MIDIGDRDVKRMQVGESLIWDDRQNWKKYVDSVHSSWVSGLNYRFVDESSVAYRGFFFTGSETKMIIFPPEGYRFTSFIEAQCDPSVTDGSYSIATIVNSRDTHYASRFPQAMKILSDNNGKNNYITPYAGNSSARDVSELLVGIKEDLMLNVEKVSS